MLLALHPAVDVRRSTRTVEFRYDGRVLRATFRAGCQVTGADARGHMEVMREIVGENAVPVLIDMSAIGSQDREARAIYAGDEALGFTRCCAIVIGSPVARVIGSFFLGLNRPRYPTRLFTDLDDAEAWLMAFDESAVRHG